MRVPKDDPVRLLSAVLDRIDYRRINAAYSRLGRNEYAQYRHTQIVNGGVAMGRVRVGHAGRTVGEDDARGLPGSDFIRGYAPRHDLRIDTAFPHSPRDELGILAAEIQDDDSLHIISPLFSAGPVV